jgi:DNA-binding Lrp family transcriptional regulator
LQIDDLDRRIIAELLRDARSTYAEIGTRVGLSPSAVKRRIDRLRREGAITGFSAVLRPDVAGDTEAFVELYCRGSVSPDAIAKVLERHAQVIAAYIVSGEPDALVHMRTHSVGELDDVLEQIRAELPAERTQSSVVLAHLVRRPPSIAAEPPTR